MSGAFGQNYRIGHRRSGGTPENPVWLAVVDYTKQDISKAANGDDFFSAKFRIYPFQTSKTRIAPVALLRYEQEYQPAVYQIVWEDHHAPPTGTSRGRNPNSFDLFRSGDIWSTLPDAKTDFREWWESLTDNLEDSGNAIPDGRAQLLRQMAAEGIIACIDNLDIPAALEIIKTTRSINHVNWQVYRDQLTTMLEARLVNHWHLMSPEQQAKHTQYIPPPKSTNSGTSMTVHQEGASITITA